MPGTMIPTETKIQELWMMTYRHQKLSIGSEVKVRGKSWGRDSKCVSEKEMFTWGLLARRTKEQLGFEDERIFKARWAGSSREAKAGTNEPELGWK